MKCLPLDYVGTFVASVVLLILPPDITAGAGGPLRVHSKNPRYFTDGTEFSDGSSSVLLTGSTHLGRT